ncbi:Copper resistance protein D [Candidatus Paraburkholderia kirkii]|nr:Copper resistance protein D [Candidatus Paraburkholderia kirkii]
MMSDDSLWFAQVGFACALGTLILDGWLCGEQAFAPVSPARSGWRRARRAGTAAAIALVLCNFVSLWLQSAAMSGAPITQAGASLWLVATATHAGIGWSVGLAGSVLLLLAAAPGGPLSAARIGFAMLAVLIVAAGKSAVGHAADAGAFSFAEAVQALYLLATRRVVRHRRRGRVRAARAGYVSVARAFLIRTVARMSHAAAVTVADRDGCVQRVARRRRLARGADGERLETRAARESRADLGGACVRRAEPLVGAAATATQCIDDGCAHRYQHQSTSCASRP